MTPAPALLFGHVMHQRLAPRANGFKYPIAYLVLPITRLAELDRGIWFGVNRPALLGYHTADHGARTAGHDDNAAWVMGILRAYGMAMAAEHITLVALPRMLGYVFNPVSFWLCRDEGGLRAVLCEVNNTFGETHSYLCRAADGGYLQPDSWVEAEKIFHVSPFLDRIGHYRFRFLDDGARLGIWIDYYHPTHGRQLATALTGQRAPFTSKNLRRVLVGYPWLTLGAVMLIHWQALKLWWLRQRYFPKPAPMASRLSATFTKHDS